MSSIEADTSGAVPAAVCTARYAFGISNPTTRSEITVFCGRRPHSTGMKEWKLKKKNRTDSRHSTDRHEAEQGDDTAYEYQCPGLQQRILELGKQIRSGFGRFGRHRHID